MVALYERLHQTLSQHVAWRVAFAAVPVPILLFTAAITLIFGTDHPCGKWEQRHLMPATAAAIMNGHTVKLDSAEGRVFQEKKTEPAGDVNVAEVDEEADRREELAAGEYSCRSTYSTTAADSRPSSTFLPSANAKEVDIAVNEVLTLKTALKILSSPLTWLPALSYMCSFGFGTTSSLSRILGALVNLLPFHQNSPSTATSAPTSSSRTRRSLTSTPVTSLPSSVS